ncbi:GIY-YIG nuclease family protein [Fulvivirga lutea]|uniref:GIY-YIG nuclease family protein n=1 Tax=Fulvivirga lutea TaxID=2810512 RepID=A0A975A272_9BACT|nr:GIY-YIG nuclease family protein [Fulvivirga lutea]QSE99174.1 GIY-YIG nuclease family protein [Fulvivirga lutea]
MNKYYIGSTSLLPEERLEQHINKKYGNNKFIAKVYDWELYVVIECESKKQSIQIEKHIKRMKSRTYIANLVKYPEIIDKLKLKYL